METIDTMNFLLKLGIAIDSSLAAWKGYLDTLPEQLTYEAIIANDIQDATTKAKALLHLLEVLPSRHAALIISYGDSTLKFIELSAQCANLLSELQKPESHVELKSWFNRTITNKKLVNSIAQFERDVNTEEQGRLQELRRLKAIYLGLMSVYEDSELGEKEVEDLLDAMEEVGVSLAVPGAFTELADGTISESGEALQDA
jgi:hypothetical protein